MAHPFEGLVRKAHPSHSHHSHQSFGSELFWQDLSVTRTTLERVGVVVYPIFRNDSRDFFRCCIFVARGMVGDGFARIVSCISQDAMGHNGIRSHPFKTR